MASDSAGQIGLDLVVNRNQFEKQMSGITGIAKKAGAVLAAAFAVKKIVDFGAQCIQLGSDLAEVQNVVDVTFPQMSKQVDKFAQDAAASFGLSETMAKKFTGTFGAMAKSFGFNEQAAYDMSTTLTGLSGDVASFYNLSQDEAFTKLKSVFTGETESLKDLGIVMTQTALDQYALANGYGKTTQAMSEGEKVALRYKFVTDQLTLASGDFLRTSDGWANQVRLLKLQFDSLKATIGQGLINILTPVIKVINTIIGKLMSLANAFKAFTEMITGKKGSGGGASAQTAGMDAVAASAENATGALGGAGGAAKKAAKDIKTSTTGIDELNVLSADTGGSGGGSGGGGGGAGGYDADEFDMGEIDPTPVDELDTKYQGLIDKAKELASIFKDGIKIGFGDTAVFDTMQTSITGIKESLKEIFTDPEVNSAANSFLNIFVYNLGKEIGAMASIGATIADNLLGGINLYLEQNSGRIKEFLVSMFDIGSELSMIKGNIAEAAATIFSAFRSDDAKQITADIIGIFSNGFMGAVELCTQFGVDVLDLITAPFVNNQDLIKTSLEGTFSAIGPIFSELKSIVDEVFTKLKTTYDEHIAPMINSYKTGLTEIVTALLEAYNQYILPVLQALSERFAEFRDQYLSPLMDKFCEFAGKVAEYITYVWENVIKPFVLWFIEFMGPVIKDTLEVAIDVFFTFWEAVSEVVGYVLDALGNVIDFLLGVFTGDWQAAWTAVKDFVSSIWEGIKALIEAVLLAIYGFLIVKMEFIRSLIENVLNLIKSKWDEIWNGIKTFSEGVWNNLCNIVSVMIEKIRRSIDEKLGQIKAKWDEIWEAIKAIVQLAIDLVKLCIETTIDTIKTNWDTVWSSIRDFLSGIWEEIKSKVSGTIEEIRTAIDEKITEIKAKWDEIWGGVKESTEKIFGGIWEFIKGVINNIIGGVETMANGVVKAINKMIEALNNISFELPDWLPGDLGGKSFGLDIPTINEVSIPRLAQGGYVRANTPQLAMIGDNRHYGEIVAPEDKMQEMANRAAMMAGGMSGMSDQYLQAMVDLLKRIIDLIESMDLTVNLDIREIKRELVRLDKRSGFTMRAT